MADEMQLCAGEYLLYEGEDSDEMYLLTRGTLAVMKKQGSGEKQIGTIYTGEIVGEMSFLDKAPRSASVKAMGECELTVIHRLKFERGMEEFPVWYKALVQTLLIRLRKANPRIRI